MPSLSDHGAPDKGAPLTGRTLDLDVGPVAHGGWCVARHEGRVVFVRHALPGERVRALVTSGRERDRFLRADAIEVIDASPDRVTPPCPYARPGACGGCDWQHASLPAQRRLKAAVVKEQLRRLAGLDRDVVVEEVPGAPDGLGWRTRVQFAVDDEGRAGLFRHRSHQVVPIDRCLIAHPLLESIGVEAHRWPAGASVEAATAVAPRQRSVLVDAGGVRAPRLPKLDPEVWVALAPGMGPERPAGARHRGGQERTSGMGAAAGTGPRRVHGRTYLTEQAAGRSWRVTLGGFWQVHPGAADALVEAVLAGLEPQPGETALDLYSGVGLFAGALADQVGTSGQVVAIESDARAAKDARRNLHDLPAIQIIHDRVDRALRRGDPAPAAVDLVVLDPPRSGAGKTVVEQIVRRGPRAVAYVACDPAALARDLATFAGHGYELADLRAFDLFPMTHHVECVALLHPRVP